VVGELRYLIDTNIWLEILLEQENYQEAKEFLQKTDASLLAISEFSLYSIGIILTRLKKADIFKDFLSDTLEDSGIMRICLKTNDLKEVISIAQKFRTQKFYLHQSLFFSRNFPQAEGFR